MNFFGGFNTKSGRTDKETEAIEQSANQYNEGMGAKPPDKKDDEDDKNSLPRTIGV